MGSLAGGLGRRCGWMRSGLCLCGRTVCGCVCVCICLVRCVVRCSWFEGMSIHITVRLKGGPALERGRGFCARQSPTQRIAQPAALPIPLYRHGADDLKGLFRDGGMTCRYVGCAKTCVFDEVWLHNLLFPRAHGALSLVERAFSSLAS